VGIFVRVYLALCGEWQQTQWSYTVATQPNYTLYVPCCLHMRYVYVIIPVQAIGPLRVCVGIIILSLWVSTGLICALFADSFVFQTIV
jgi:hypothetical protein